MHSIKLTTFSTAKGNARPLKGPQGKTPQLQTDDHLTAEKSMLAWKKRVNSYEKKLKTYVRVVGGWQIGKVL